MPGKKSAKGGVFRDPTIGKSRMVQEALTPYRRGALRREIEEFCKVPDASDLEDARGALPAQRQALNRD